MKKWEKWWLLFVIFFAYLHIIRDIYQDLGIQNFLSTVLSSPGPPKIHYVVYWTIFNTYVIAGIEILLSIICLKRNYFGRVGLVTIIIAVVSLILWIVYYFFL